MKNEEASLLQTDMGLDENSIKENEIIGDEEEQDSSTNLHFEIMNYPADYSLKGYREMWDKKQLHIPEFQRNYVWDEKQASRLIESFLLGLSVPGVFLYKEREGSKYLVIDGQQRIKTVVSFLKGKFQWGKLKGKAFILKEISSKWIGKGFKELDQKDRFKLETAIMRSTIIQQLDPQDKSSIYHIFERLNTGGTNLSPMEVRMCVSEGSFINMLADLNKNGKWRQVFGKKEEDNRSKDKELILRVIALYDYAESEEVEYKTSMKRFLNDYIEKNKNAKEDIIKQKKTIFLKALEKACYLEEKPFHLENRINYSITDSVLVALMRTSLSDEDRIKESYKKLLDTKEFINLVKRGHTFKTAVEKRLKLAKNAFSPDSD